MRRDSASAGRRSAAIENRPARNSERISSGDAEPEDDSVAVREALPPVVGVPLQLEPLPRLEPDDAERPGPDAALAPVRAERDGPLGDDGGRRVRDDSGEERERLLELDDELPRRDDVEPLEVRDLSVDEGPRAPDRREERAALALGVLEVPLEGEADVARRERSPVVEPHAAPEPEAEARAALLGEDLRGEPRDDPRPLDVPRQRLEDDGATSVCSPV